MIGQSVGHYEIMAKLGQGGMGEVYRARDTRLNREVAIKVLPQMFASDEQRMGRFEREAQVLASLNHPNIAAIYGLETRDAVPTAGVAGPGTAATSCLVMELVEGEDLSERVARGPIPLDEALSIALQVAEALENAHERGIIHRDLKPANIKLTPEGKVKILDFGLAKALEDPFPGPESRVPGVSQSPTLTMAATQAGIILGTAAYMSPEQARGKPVDRRADIWSFGVVLWEMLTGRPVFEGEDLSQILAFVIGRDPEWSRVPPAIPEPIRDLLKRCLRRDVNQRIQSIGDVRIAIEEYLADPLAHQAELQSGQAPLLSSGRKLFLAATALMLAALTFVLGWGLKSGPSVPAFTSRFSLVLPQDQQLSYSGRHQVALSPDGQHLVYAANTQLYHRAMNLLAAEPISGTAEGGGRNPFFSPDGQWIGFWAAGELRKVPLGGGSPVTLCQAGNPFGASWVSEERILLGQGAAGIFEVPADGGERKLLIEVDSSAGEMAHGPQLLPGGKDLLFTLAVRSNWDQAQIVVQSLETGDRKIVFSGGKDARYLPSGHLVYSWEGSLWAVPFDPLRLELTGSPVTVIERVSESGSAFTGAVHFSPSQSGSLVYIPGTGGSITSTLVWIDRAGQEETLLADQFYQLPRISPDGERVVLTVLTTSGSDIWVHDLKRSTRTRLTFEGLNQMPVWSPDGKAVVFTSNQGGESHLYRKSADGTGQAERLTLDPGILQSPGDFSPDGKALVFQQLEYETSTDLYLLSLDSNKKTQPLLKTRFNEAEPSISPDGRWIAYMSDESGRPEVYVRPFPEVEQGKWQISTEGGRDPLWGPEGKELYFLSDRALMVSAIEATDTFSAGIPRTQVKIPSLGTSDQSEWGKDWDISPDGERFLITTDAADMGNQAELVVVLNWFEELRRLAPTK